MINSLLLKVAIEIVDVPIKHGDFPVVMFVTYAVVIFSEGLSGKVLKPMDMLSGFSPFRWPSLNIPKCGEPRNMPLPFLTRQCRPGGMHSILLLMEHQRTTIVLTR